jgi:hypothetical protein
MSGGAASPSFYSFPNDLGEENLAIRSLRHSFKALSLACTNIQILQLAQSFRQWSDDEIIRCAEESRQHGQSFLKNSAITQNPVASRSSNIPGALVDMPGLRMVTGRF